MKAFFASVRREFALIFRNGITIFMVAAPAILALVFILVFGAVNSSTLQLAIDSSVSASEEKKLMRVADVQRFDNTADMESRVRETDAVIGVTLENGAANIVVEGNEDTAFIEGTQAIVGLALGATSEIPAYKSETVDAKGTMAYTVTMIAMLLMSLFIGGATVGMSIVDERECGVIRAVAVSPIRLSGYVATKLFPAFVLGAFGMSAAALIIGKASILPQYLLLALASILISGMMAFAVGGLANNQVAAVGVLKLLVPVGMILPVSAMFVPLQWQFIYYILPMYWQYRALRAILSGAPALLFTCLTLLVSIPWFLSAVWIFSKKTTFRKAR